MRNQKDPWRNPFRFVVLTTSSRSEARRVARSLAERGVCVLLELEGAGFVFCGELGDLRDELPVVGPFARIVVADDERVQALPEASRRAVTAWNDTLRALRRSAERPRAWPEVPSGRTCDGRPKISLEELAVMAAAADLALPAATSRHGGRVGVDETVREALRALVPGDAGEASLTGAQTEAWVRRLAEDAPSAWRALLPRFVAPAIRRISSGFLEPPPLEGRVAVALLQVDSRISGGPKLSGDDSSGLRVQYLIGLATLAVQHPAGKLTFVAPPTRQFSAFAIDNGSESWLDDVQKQLRLDPTLAAGELRGALALPDPLPVFANRTLSLILSPDAALAPPTFPIDIEFSSVDPSGDVPLASLVAQINAALPSPMAKVTPNGRLELVPPPGKRIAVAPGTANEVLGFESHAFTGGVIGAYLQDVRFEHGVDHAIMVIQTAFAPPAAQSSLFGKAPGPFHVIVYAGKMLTLGSNAAWNWILGGGTVAHELCHLFGATDEYARSEGDVCRDVGARRMPNRNGDGCSDPSGRALSALPCMMRRTSLRLCAFTQAQIGWAHLVVEVGTADESFAGTDDDVFLDIGERQFLLDTPEREPVEALFRPVNDHERGGRGAYGFYEPQIGDDHIRRLLLRKAPDTNLYSAWAPSYAWVWVRGKVMWDGDIDALLGGDHLTHLLDVWDHDLVNDLTVTVRTSSDLGAGTDDWVYFDTASRTWELDRFLIDDFEAGTVATYVLDPGVGLRLSHMSTVGLRKSADGAFGAWKVGGLKVVANGTFIYDRDDIEQWLGGSSLTFTDTR